MKRCKHCKNFPVCKYNYDKTKNDVCENSSDVGDYVRKSSLWFAFWIPKILLITLALLLCGCVHVKLSDGTEYWRLGEQQIGEVLFTLPDGSAFKMEQQKSTIPVLIVTPTSFQFGEARKVER